MSGFARLASGASCFLLVVLIYARLTGYDLGLSAVTTHRSIQCALFFGLINVVLLCAASAWVRGVASDGGSAVPSACYLAISGILVAAAIVGLDWAQDGHLNDLPQFVRFEAARASRMIAPALALTACLLAPRPERRSLSMDPPARALRRCLGVLSLLMVVTAIVYTSDRAMPWSDPMAKQLVLVSSGLVGPALVLAVMAFTMRSAARIGAVFGLVAFILAAALV